MMWKLVAVSLLLTLSTLRSAELDAAAADQSTLLHQPWLSTTRSATAATATESQSFVDLLVRPRPRQVDKNRQTTKQPDRPRRSPPTVSARRRRRRSAVDWLSGVTDAEQRRRLTELASVDVVTALLEYNELVLEMANTSHAKNCWMRLGYNITTGIGGWNEIFRDQVQNILQTANALNNALLSPPEVSSLNDALYLALVKSLVSSDPLVYGAVIVLEPGHAAADSPRPTASTPAARHAPYVFRNATTGRLQVQYIDVVRDVAREFRGQQTGNNANMTEELAWFWRQRANHFSRQLWPHRDVCGKVVAATSGDTPAAASSPSDQATVVTTAAEGMWSVPHFDCSRARSWTISFSVPFFGCVSQQNLGFKGVLKADLNLGRIDIDQCKTDNRLIFRGSHRCPNTMKCIHIPDGGFRRGNYRCQCPASSRPQLPVVSSSYATGSNVTSTPHYQAPGDLDGSELERLYVEQLLTGTDMTTQCARCERGCPAGPCAGDQSCYADYDILLRGIPMGVQSLCVTVAIVLTIVVVRLRKTKVMKVSFWCFLEVILLGALMLYATVIVQYFEPTQFSCLLIPWLREVGFAIVYGALILKVYRVLAEFQSRKAHRVQIRDKDLLKYLCCILIVVIGYMAAWTAVTLDYGGQQGTGSMLETGITPDNLIYFVCQSKWWDYVIEAAELLFMCFAIYICYCTRSAPSNYREVRFISWAIYNETVVSAVFYITRHVFWLYVHPDYIFLMYFVRCQLTVSIMLMLVLGPKLWYSRRPLDEDTLRGRAYSTCEAQDNTSTPGAGLSMEAAKLSPGINLNGDVDIGEINLSEMNPEDIRCELKRLYTQLQIYKTKTMRQDNPHISKRRGGRKQTHRRFSLQAFHSKHKFHHSGSSGATGGGGGGGSSHGGGGGACGEPSVAGGETEVSRTPEDSMNSAEGVSVYADESSVADVRSPTVTFKPGHKSKHAS